MRLKRVKLKQVKVKGQPFKHLKPLEDKRELSTVKRGSDIGSKLNVMEGTRGITKKERFFKRIAGATDEDFNLGESLSELGAGLVGISVGLPLFIMSISKDTLTSLGNKLLVGLAGGIGLFIAGEGLIFLVAGLATLTGYAVTKGFKGMRKALERIKTKQHF